MLILVIFIIFIFLLTVGMPVNFALGFLGIIGLLTFVGWSGLDAAAMVAWSSANSFTLTAIPLFIFMGDMIMRAGFGNDLFTAASAWFGRWRGGLAVGTIFACGIFSAVSGSSAAACATMGLLAIPEMERYGYNKRLIYGTLTSGGSLDILIPPSVILIVYGAFTEQSIAKLYLAGFIPGFILGFFFICVIYIWARIYPESAPTVDLKHTFKQKLAITKHALIFVLLMVACLGTIYIGIATPTEAAGLGAFFTLVAAVIMRRISWAILKECLLSTVKVTCMVLFLILGGLILSNVLLVKNIPNEIMQYAFALHLPKWGVLLALYVIYTLMGCLIDGLTLMIITLPIVAPTVAKLGFDMVWFGIVIVMLVELSQLHPPVGMNLFIIRNIGNAKIEDVIVGSAPFLIAIVAGLLLITIFPQIVTYVPNLLSF